MIGHGARRTSGIELQSERSICASQQELGPRIGRTCDRASRTSRRKDDGRAPRSALNAQGGPSSWFWTTGTVLPRAPRHSPRLTVHRAVAQQSAKFKGQGNLLPGDSGSAVCERGGRGRCRWGTPAGQRLFFRKTARKVYMLVRSVSCRIHVAYLIQRIEENHAIELHYKTGNRGLAGGHAPRAHPWREQGERQ